MQRCARRESSLRAELLNAVFSINWSSLAIVSLLLTKQAPLHHLNPQDPASPLFPFPPNSALSTTFLPRVTRTTSLLQLRLDQTLDIIRNRPEFHYLQARFI